LFNISDSYAGTPIRWFIVVAAPLRCALFANSTWAIQFAENLVAIATNLLLLKEVMNGNDGLAFPLKRVTETIFATIRALHFVQFQVHSLLLRSNYHTKPHRKFN
jgi:hypothetical protein